MARFNPPSEDAIAEAIGIAIKMDDGNIQDKFEGYELKYEDKYPQDISTKNLLRCLIPESSSFKCINVPESDDWLNNHQETGQTFHNFISTPHNTPNKTRCVLYIQPFNIKEDHVSSNILKAVTEYSQIFFGMKTDILEPICLCGQVPERINAFSNTLQINAKFVLEKLKLLLPADGYCLTGVTLCDLYPRDDWNFVFGIANKTARVGVHSLARYLDNFGSNVLSIYSNASEVSTLHRSCKTLCHEIGHMFGLSHCVFFQCLMNGSNHLDEMDSRPVFLCPVCLRKLHFSCGFNILERYEQMLQFWSKRGAQDEMEWLRTRIAFLLSGNC